ncbi:SCO2322 family protein [Streptomyces sp. CB03238]|uniref:SCO2322 family protein n=1 Tax=Streptomyces sp. CB03238 TaxID=1907777 RepID=UPI0026C0C131
MGVRHAGSGHRPARRRCRDRLPVRGEPRLPERPPAAPGTRLRRDLRFSAKDGTKRVGLVIDFGTAADASTYEPEPPPALRTTCAQVRTDATTTDALATVAKPLRYNNQGLLCAIADYPKTGCGELVSWSPPPGVPPLEPAGSPESHPVMDLEPGPSVGLVAGLAAVAVLGAAAVWQARRRRR